MDLRWLVPFRSKETPGSLSPWLAVSSHAVQANLADGKETGRHHGYVYPDRSREVSFYRFANAREKQHNRAVSFIIFYNSIPISSPLSHLAVNHPDNAPFFHNAVGAFRVKGRHYKNLVGCLSVLFFPTTTTTSTTIY